MGTQKTPGVVAFHPPAQRLAYTGERFTSGQGGPIEHEHRHRYLIAASICRGKDVLDIASGEGFGSAFLSSVANHCTGVDIDAEAISFARSNYNRTNLEYRQGSATSIPLPDASVDVVVSFETIEHFYDHDAFMREVRRVLRPNGMMLISSPNRGIYDGTGNHFHVRELTQKEFVATLQATFANIHLFEQKATTGSIICPADGKSTGAFQAFLRLDDFSYECSSTLVQAPYSLILASDGPLPELDVGVLDDQGFVNFLHRRIANADAHYEAMIADIGKKLDAALAEKQAIEHLHAELNLKARKFKAEQQRQRLESAKQVARFGLEQARLYSRGLIANTPLATSDAVAKVASELQAAKHTILQLKSSTSWRISAPLRATAHMATRLKKKLHRAMRGPRLEEAPSASPITSEGAHPISKYQAHILEPAPLTKRILLVAETNLQQCAKYRVWQKKEAIESLGYECTVVNWGNGAEVRRLLQTHAAVIFYRVPGWPESLDNMREARRLGIPTYWEVDDLIFDLAAYQQNKNLDLLSAEEKASVLSGAPLFREALLACGRGIASTETIARYMREAGAEEVVVIQNALDRETLRIAERLTTEPRKEKSAESVIVFYGSGSRSHDMDFREAAGGLEKLLEIDHRVHLQVAGTLELPLSFARFADRIQRLPMSDFETYLGHLSSADISIAPLEKSIFNDAKSNIKYLESAVLAVPSVCSPSKTFAAIVQHGINGFMASSAEDWFECLTLLANDPHLRHRIGKRARQTALQSYSPESVTRELTPLLSSIVRQDRKALTVLAANIYFDPQSFGGATVVCEQLARRLHHRVDTAVSVFTTLGVSRPDYDLVRYQLDGLSVFAAKMPAGINRYLEYENYQMAEVFLEVLRATRPDVVHLHSIQGLSASIADACLLSDIPYVITCHDAWWLCERQFMVNSDSRYCGQKKIDLSICAQCVPDIEFTRIRTNKLRRILDNAALVVTPSEFSRQLYISNGLSPERVRVNRNGIAPPESRTRTSSPKLRFGFVGGVGGIKGLDLVLRAFADLDYSNYELVLVDNTMNLGISSMDASSWKIKGKLTILPAYTQAELDTFFSQLDVLLFPSQVKESFGLTVREALIRDVWVIATDAGGAVEDIRQGVNGDILPFTNDHRPLRNAIQNLLDAPERLSDFRNPFADKIRTYDTQAAELRDILHEVVETHRQQMRVLEAIDS